MIVAAFFGLAAYTTLNQIVSVFIDIVSMWERTARTPSRNTDEDVQHQQTNDCNCKLHPTMTYTCTDHNHVLYWTDNH